MRITVISVLLGAPLFAADVILRGRVIDENGAPVRGAIVTVRPRTAAIAAPPEGFWEAQTDPDGVFAFTLPGPGDIAISVEREGYYALKDQALHLESSQELTLTINNVREVFQSTNVNAETSPVDINQTQNQERLTGTEVNDMPYANSHSLRNAMRLMPGRRRRRQRRTARERIVRESGALPAQWLQPHKPHLRPISDASRSGRHSFGRPGVRPLSPGIR